MALREITVAENGFSLGLRVTVRGLPETYSGAEFTISRINAAKPSQCYIHPDNPIAEDVMQNFFGVQDNAGKLVNDADLISIGDNQHA